MVQDTNSRESYSSSSRPTYVRQPRPHATQSPISDFQTPSNQEPSYSHDSSYTLSSRKPIQGRTYRRARSDQAKVRQELKYGQYLSVPKGNKEIFSSHERQASKRRAIAAIVAFAIALILIIVFWPK